MPGYVVPGRVSLTWSTVTYGNTYNVKRSTTNGGPYTTIASTAGTSYTDTGLNNGTTYYYVVSASDASGESPNSAQVAATITWPYSIQPINVTGFNANGVYGTGSGPTEVMCCSSWTYYASNAPSSPGGRSAHGDHLHERVECEHDV